MGVAVNKTLQANQSQHVDRNSLTLGLRDATQFQGKLNIFAGRLPGKET